MHGGGFLKKITFLFVRLNKIYYLCIINLEQNMHSEKQQAAAAAEFSKRWQGRGY